MKRRSAVVLALCLGASSLFAAAGRDGREVARVTRGSGTATMVTGSSRMSTLRGSVMRMTPVDAGQRWVATRAIYADGTTGRVRKPNTAETALLVRTLQNMTQRSAASRFSVSSDGVRQASNGESYIVLSRPTEEGGTETLCVSTFEEAAAFLGLVQAPAGASR
jgi:hypothetical protein